MAMLSVHFEAVKPCVGLDCAISDEIKEANPLPCQGASQIGPIYIWLQVSLVRGYPPMVWVSPWKAETLRHVGNESHQHTSRSSLMERAATMLRTLHSTGGGGDDHGAARFVLVALPMVCIPQESSWYVPFVIVVPTIWGGAPAHHAQLVHICIRADVK